MWCNVDFKYYKNVSEVFEEWEVQCEVCWKNVNCYYDGGVYGDKDFEIICIDCIKNWKIKEFGCFFNEVCDMNIDESIKEEIEYKTPSLESFQEQCWPCHCGDACIYLWVAKLDDEKYYNETLKEELGLDDLNVDHFKSLLEKWYLLKFQCNKCWKIKFVLDLD